MKKVNLAVSAQSYLPCLLSGLMFGLAAPSYPYVRLEILAWVWLAPLLIALKPIRSFGLFLRHVYLATLVTCVFGMACMLFSSPLGTVFLFLLGAAVFSVPFIGFYFIRAALGWRAALWSMPVLWTAWEWLYHQSAGSIGWLSLGLTQANLYWLFQYADLTGVWGITFWVVLFNVLVVRALEDRGSQSPSILDLRSSILNPRLLRRLVAMSAAMLAFPLAYSAYVFGLASSASRAEISVLLVQPNLDPWEKLDQGKRAAIVGKTLALTDAAVAKQQPDLVIWPEVAVPYIWRRENAVQEFVARAVSRWQTPLLTGTLDQRVYHNPAERPPLLVYEQKHAELFNAALLLAPDKYREAVEPNSEGRRFKVSSSGFYHKQVLMPFIEQVPLAEQYPALSQLAIKLGAGGTYTAGSEATTFSFKDRQGTQVTVAAPICYEQFYPAKLAEFVRGGAQLLALITNDGWFSKTHGPYRIAAFTRLRAIELRRSIARVANTGLTCFIDPWGRSYGQVPWWEEQTVMGQVKLSQELSLYARYPDYFPQACAWLSLALALAVLWQLVRRAMPGASSSLVTDH